jgi:hypothetical protein
MKDHVCPVLARRIPTIDVLISTFFQEGVRYFTVYMLLFIIRVKRELKRGAGWRELTRLSYTRKYISFAAESARGWGLRLR